MLFRRGFQTERSGAPSASAFTSPPDGTIVATTYTTYREADAGCSIVSVRFKMSEIDAMVPSAGSVKPRR